MTGSFNPYKRNYASLSIKDLLDARHAAHVQFSHMTTVFATAIGLYRIRMRDDDAKGYQSADKAARKRGKLGARTLENTTVKPWSWPCVLVFVKEWLPENELPPDQVVPPFIFLTDGRVVPVCAVQGSLYAGSPPPATGPLTFSSQIIGGGYPVVTDVQGREHVGSIACIVSDGEKYYALTNQHVAGTYGREIYSRIKGERTQIGLSAQASLRKKPFGDIFPTFAGSDVQANLDIGLIDIDDISLWTSRVFGLGVLGEAFDFNAQTVSLDWIGAPLVAYGAVSGRMEGEVKALFYRYGTLNGTEYVSDFLIGGRGTASLRTARGDSGTLWCLDPEADLVKEDPRQGGATEPPAPEPRLFAPVAVEWGGQKLAASGGDRFTQYALASSVAVACRALDVEIVTDLNTEHDQYWGAVGHYKIAELAIGLVSGSLGRFLSANLKQLSYDAATIAAGDLPHDASQFVPLADVPDIVWKTNMNMGGKAARAQENWNHYADLDLPGPDGRTLSDMVGTPPKLVLEEWIEFYKTAKPPAASGSKSNNMGALPFRVWQIFDAMLDFKAKRDAVRFLCAAGVLSHYVADACQPLHGSMHSDGLDGARTGVHGVYEEKMIDRFAVDLRADLDAFPMSSLGAKLALVKTGHAAGAEIIKLMRRCAKRLPPDTICREYNRLGGGTGAPVVKALWAKFEADTIACIADGSRTLAMLWTSAYRAGGPGSFTRPVTQTKLQGIYEDKDFLPSLHLAHLKPADYPPPA